MRNKFTKQAQTALTLAKAAAIDFELGLSLIHISEPTRRS